MASAKIGSLRVDLGLDSAQFAKGLKKSQSRMQKFGQTMRKAIKPVAVGVSAAFGGIGLALRGALKDADKMAKASQKFGIPVEELSRLRHAAELSGVAFEGVGNGLRRLSRNMADFANGAGEAKDAFQTLGIDVTDAEGKLKSSTAVMGEIADQFAAMEDGAQKTALAAEVFGARYGPELIPLLNQGKDGIAELMAEADKLGITISEGTAKDAEIFNDNMTRLGKTFSGLGAQLAERLAPHLADFSDWLVRNGPQIVDVVAAVADFTAKAIRLGAAIAGPVIEAVRMLARGWRMVTEATQAVIDAFVGLKNRGLAAVEEFVTGAVSWLGDKLQPALDALLAPIRAVEGAFSWLKDRVVGNSHVPEMVDGIAAEFQRLDGVMVQPAQRAAAGVDRTFSDMGRSITDPLKQAFKEGELNFESFREAALSIATRMRDQLIERAFAPIEDAISRLFGGGSGGGGFFGNLFGSLFGGGGGTQTISGAPHLNLGGSFAHGGVPPVGKLSLVGENGPELVRFGSTARVFSNAESRQMVGASGGRGVRDVNVEGSTIIMQGSQATPEELRRELDRRDRRLVERIIEMNEDDPETLHT